MDKDSNPDIIVRETQSQEDSFFKDAQRVDDELTNYFVEETQQEIEDNETSESIEDTKYYVSHSDDNVCDLCVILTDSLAFYSVTSASRNLETELESNTQLASDDNIAIGEPLVPIENKDRPSSYCCGQCDRTFKQKDNLNRYMMSQHQSRNEECLQCGKMFPSKYSQKRHHKQVHQHV